LKLIFDSIAKARGVSVSTENLDGLFQVDDERVRVECEFANGDNCFFASVMCDTGAQGELTLPARKIVQLGLRPYATYHVKGSTNDSRQSCRFEPAVKVTMRFMRDGEEVESRTALLVVSCHKNEYYSELAAVVPVVSFSSGESEPNESSTEIMPTVSATVVSSRSGEPVLNASSAEAMPAVTAGSKRKLSEVTDDTVTDTSSSVEPLKAVRLSPVVHRPPGQPNQHVVLGRAGMRKFHVHANIDKSSLEIEDEIYYEE
jgi:hypothetical protein